jgi:hypothetical protein
MGLLKDLYAELKDIFEAEKDAPDEIEEEEVKPKVKKNSKVATLAQVKAKLKEVLDTKGRPAAVKVLEAFDAEKVGDLDEEEYQNVIEECERSLKKKAPKVEEDDDDL